MMLFKNESDALKWLLAAGISLKSSPHDSGVISLSFQVPEQTYQGYPNYTQEQTFVSAVNAFAESLQITSIKDTTESS
jgi:hypothetical protein